MTDEVTTDDTVASSATTDATESATASAPDRSTDEGATGVASASEQPDTATKSRPVRKVREGVVVSNKMDKTAVVAVIERVRHPKYNKTVLQTKHLYAHDEANDVNIGDRVRVMETRPLSKSKHWRVTDVLERAK